MKIRTSFDGVMWTAVDDDTYDGAPDSKCPIGWGSTEEEAIDDLKMQIEDTEIW